MIGVTDTIVLATTKLRSHRIRTGITIGVSGVLFGLIIAVVLIVQGVFSSVERFSDEGLNSRYVMSLTRSGDALFSIYDHREDTSVVKRVEKAHAAYVDKKVAVAKKYGIAYDPKTEDPSPILIDPVTKKKTINEDALDSPAVTKVADDIIREKYKPFDPDAYLKKYKSAKVIGPESLLMPQDGLLVRIKDGKETELTKEQKRAAEFGFTAGSEVSLSLLPQTLAQPFVSSHFDASKGEIPVILPYSSAEKLLGLKPLKNATNQQKRDRIQEVRRRVGEVTTSFCYRNTASSMLLDQAKQVVRDSEKNKQNPNYQKPAVMYTLPTDASCGPVKITSDTRTTEEKQAEKNMRSYQQEISGIDGTPRQQKITLRGVGISADQPGADAQASVSGLVQSLFSTSLGYGTWNIPEGLLQQVPASAKPAAVFGAKEKKGNFFAGGYMFESYLVEFGDKQEARSLLKATGFFGGNNNGSIFAAPYGSASLLLDELKDWANKILFWVLIIVGAVAALILSGLVGRTIADGRRETAVFRAIGATRSTITVIYLVYTILFSLRVIVFAAILALVLAGGVHVWLHQDATIGAQLAFNTIDQTKEFNLIDVRSGYIPIIIGLIIVVGLISAILPLLRNIRRNPIRDMRDE